MILLSVSFHLSTVSGLFPMISQALPAAGALDAETLRIISYSESQDGGMRWDDVTKMAK